MIRATLTGKTLPRWPASANVRLVAVVGKPGWFALVRHNSNSATGVVTWMADSVTGSAFYVRPGCDYERSGWTHPHHELTLLSDGSASGLLRWRIESQSARLGGLLGESTRGDVAVTEVGRRPLRLAPTGRPMCLASGPIDPDTTGWVLGPKDELMSRDALGRASNLAAEVRAIESAYVWLDGTVRRPETWYRPVRVAVAGPADSPDRPVIDVRPNGCVFAGPDGPVFLSETFVPAEHLLAIGPHLLAIGPVQGSERTVAGWPPSDLAPRLYRSHASADGRLLSVPTWPFRQSSSIVVVDVARASVRDVFDLGETTTVATYLADDSLTVTALTLSRRAGVRHPTFSLVTFDLE